MKNCGKLDKNRYLCVNDFENCHVDDVMCNDESSYQKNDIIYETVKINDKEYLHYTNKQNDTFIITNLTVISGFGNGLPCGSSDEDTFDSFSSIETNQFCIRNDKNYNYYFYKKLSEVLLKEFFKDNKVDLSFLPEYKNLTELGKMSLFSTGYFSLSEKDIKNFKGSPSRLKKNNKFSKIMSNCSLTCFICIIIFGIYVVFFLGYFYSMNYEIVKIISSSFDVLLLLIITICGLIEMIMGDKVFKLTGDFPIYYSDILKDIEFSKASIHFWAYGPFLIIEIIILTISIVGYVEKRREKNKSYSCSHLNQKKKYSTKNTPIPMETKNETPGYNSDFQYTPPTPS